MNTEQSFFDILHTIEPIVHSIKGAGGITYLVGGCVRDLVLGKPLKDLDLEVHQLTIEQLESILKLFNSVIMVGKTFGVLRIVGLDADWSLPRKDSKGRKPTVSIDPFMGIEEACRRRDLTMNAMAINLNEIGSKLHIIDPYGGIEDIKKRQLRAVDTILFLEDPLRFFRVMQFIARFEMLPDTSLTQLCKTMNLKDAETNTTLARERIYEEIKKMLLKSRCPSHGLRWLESIGRLDEFFPELAATIKTPQRPDYHPEGTVFEHTMQALDAAAQITYYESDDEKLMIMFGVLCHDLGKVTTTNNDLQAIGHDEAGVDISKALLKRITEDQFLIKAVCKLVRYHLAPFALIDQNAQPKAYKRLAAKIAPEISMRQLGIVALADRQGRNEMCPEPLTNKFHNDYKAFLEYAEQASVVHKPEAPVLLGRHLLGTISPGPELGKLLDLAYQIQIDEGITDVDVLKKRALEKS